MKIILKSQLKEGLCLYDKWHRQYLTINRYLGKGMYSCTLEEFDGEELIITCRNYIVKKGKLMHLTII